MATLSYDVHPSVALMEEWIRTLPTSTGKSLTAWMRAIRAEEFEGPADARAWLKKEHGLGTTACWHLAERAFARDLSLMDDDPERYLALAPKYVDGQYAGKKAGLRAIYERLHGACRRLGANVLICPCKTIVPVYREHVFAQIKPTTNTRVDLGLCLTALLKGGRTLPDRLIDTGGFAKKDRITHRVALASPDDVDAFTLKWLARAYELDAPATTGARSLATRARAE
ncbi:MAG: DUF4287 domain-containing protein [Phycisphaerales bacterium]|nr:DUF4287 domain-containing protein [Phycisphaerales bacterium]